MHKDENNARPVAKLLDVLVDRIQRRQSPVKVDVIAMAKPKSATNGVPSVLIKMFSGFKSKCKISLECNIAIPSHMPRNNSILREGDLLGEDGFE